MASKKKKSLYKCQIELLIIWFVGTVITGLFLILTGQGGTYDNDFSATINWFMQATLPTAAVMLGVILNKKSAPISYEIKLDKLIIWIYRFVFALYFILLIGVIGFSQTPPENMSVVDNLQKLSVISVSFQSMILFVVIKYLYSTPELTQSKNK